MRNRLSFSAAALPGLVLVGCMASQDMRNDAKQAAVTGSVAYRERIALSPDAVLEVRLSDVSRQDAAPVIAETTVVPAGRQVPSRSSCTTIRARSSRIERMRCAPRFTARDG